MTAAKEPIDREQVLVRHVAAEKRKDVHHLERLLKAPFPNDSQSFSDGGSKDTDIPGYAPGRCLVAARFAKQSWAPLYCNAASAKELFEANQSSRKLEVAWLGCRPDVGWFFRLHGAGKPVVEFAQPLDDEAPSVSKLTGVEASVLKKGDSGEQAVARLAKHFKIGWPMPEVRISDDGFEVLDVHGRPLRSGLRGWLRVEGPQIAAGENPAATALAEAIEECDADGIREAIAGGAPLTVLPDTSSSPLMAALFKCEEPEGKECVELLLELGCPVNGVKNDPPLVACVDERYFSESDALEFTKLLVEHGADVNAADRDGETALFRAVVDSRIEIVRFLLDHGADPNIKDKRGVSPVEWLRGACERASFNFEERTRYAEILSLFTDKPVAKPQAAALSPALAAENERFRLCVAARRLLPLLTANVSIRRRDAVPYVRQRWFPEWQQELLDAGFQFAQHFGLGLSDQSAYTHPELGFDALVSEGDKPRCEIIAHHGDHTTTVANFKDVIEPEFVAPARVLKEFEGASPADLVEHLKELVRRKPMARIDAASFASRYTDALNRAAHATGERAQHLLQTPKLLSHGGPPRYERLGCYLDFSGWKDPGYSSANWVRDWQEEFSQANSNPPDSTDDAVDAATYLVAMRHLQFASAIEVSEYLASGSDVALAHFHALAKAPKGNIEAEPSFQFRALVRGLLLSALAGRWDTFKEICNFVQPKLASANTAQQDDLDFAQVLLLLVSSYRDRAIPKAAALEQAVEKRLAKRPRALLAVWRAIKAGRADDVAEALRASLECLVEMRKPRLVVSRSNDLFQFVSLADSLFQLAALDRGLRVPALPTHLAGMLITPETLL